ncbi:hypothetical protein [Marichromatium sp. AB31]|uniref:hypothetical protein n=1 Tax=Marichromatium sp. AB31 TaxID=2483362 RepID=UPI0011CDF174|nr:hypothetical protein [Marichromatium sp. AB31]
MDILEQIDKQIDTHVRFMDSMEQIRWRFTSAFGITALVGLLVVSGKMADGRLDAVETVAAYAIIVAVALGGFITQIRIIGLFWSEWHKIRVLQNEKLKILGERSVKVSRKTREAWSLPHIVPPERSNKLYLTVHEANCFLFSLLLSVAVGLSIYAEFENKSLAFVVMIAGTTGLTYAGHKIGGYYYRMIVKHG